MGKVLITKPRDKSQSNNQYENGTISEKMGFSQMIFFFVNSPIICYMSMLFYSLTPPCSCASTTKE